jgi:cysteinyl-tRNA synthetase
MGLRVYNTLTRRKEPFETVRPGKVGMYLCGPTVYKPSHVGHMVGPVIFDTVKRYLVYLGYDVTFVVNITDVDDKLIVQAQKQGTTVPALAARVTADYKQNLERLGVVVDRLPQATEHIPAIIAIIEGLVTKGFAYPAAGDVYFDITRDPDYGKLCHRDPAQLEAGARVEVSDKKRSPGDFALWKAAKPGEPSWDSPWGPGRPGWHIECSAMSMKLLGETLDVHGGGLDLQFPHHENELAQSESYTGRPFVRYWMHNGLMRVGGRGGKVGATNVAGDQPRKMSKSEGNEIVVTDLLKRHPAEALRALLLSSHYRSPIDYSEDRLEEMERGLNGFQRFFERYERVTGSSFYDLEGPARRAAAAAPDKPSEFLTEVARHREAFLEHMNDDFNTGAALGVLYELLNTLNRFADVSQLEASDGDPAHVDEFRAGARTLRELGLILGLFREQRQKPDAADTQLVGDLMRLLIDLRADARKSRNFALGDQIRQRLGELGVTLEDRPGGTDWRLD